MTDDTTIADDLTGIDTFAPSTGQLEAIDRAADWYELNQAVKPGDDLFSLGQSSPIFRLFGYAGTGKTTIVRHIISRLGLDSSESLVLYGAYTGKAAYVLRRKGIPDAGTIHSMIYTPVERSREHLIELRRQVNKIMEEIDIALAGGVPETSLAVANARRGIALIESEIETEKKRLRRPKFELNIDSEVRAADLVVLDEVSMVDERMAHDLMSFGTPLLVLGDPAQLPPVGGAGYFIDATPDALLTEVHRSALESPVTRIATAVRTAPEGDTLLGVHGVDTGNGRYDRWDLSWLLAHSVVLCWRNATRWNLIRQMRSALGFPEGIPVMGDKIVVLQNNREASVFNGQVLDVLGAFGPSSDDVYEIAVTDDSDNLRMLDVCAEGFTGHAGEEDAKDRARRSRGELVAATFAQALTVHKSQGSEWPSVMVVDESASLWGMKMKTTAGDGAAAHLEAQRWLYTAVTRASSQITIVR